MITPEPIGVGASEAEVRLAYGKHLTVQKGVYDDDLYDWKVYTPGGQNGLIFHTDSKRVTHIRAGRRPSIDDEEGCE